MCAVQSTSNQLIQASHLPAQKAYRKSTKKARFRAKIIGMNQKSSATRFRDGLSPATQHRRQMRWQVWAPLIASIVVFVALVTLTIIGAVGGSSQVSRWANLSSVWIITPVLLSGLIFLVIFAACIYGMSKLLKHVPGWMLRLQMAIEQVALIARRAADAAAQPVMATSSVKASAQALWRKILGKPPRKPQA